MVDAQVGGYGLVAGRLVGALPLDQGIADQVQVPVAQARRLGPGHDLESQHACEDELVGGHEDLAESS